MKTEVAVCIAFALGFSITIGACVEIFTIDELPSILRWPVGMIIAGLFSVGVAWLGIKLFGPLPVELQEQKYLVAIFVLNVTLPIRFWMFVANWWFNKSTGGGIA